MAEFFKFFKRSNPLPQAEETQESMKVPSLYVYDRDYLNRSYVSRHIEYPPVRIRDIKTRLINENISFAGEHELRWLIDHPTHPAARYFYKYSGAYRLVFFGAEHQGTIPTLAFDKREKKFRRGTPLDLDLNWNANGKVVVLGVPPRSSKIK